MVLKEFADQVIKRALKLVDDIELCIHTGKSIEYEVNNEKISPSLGLGQASVGIRVLKNNMLGASAITRLDVEEAMLAVSKALTNLKPTVLTGFSAINDCRQIRNYDKNVLNIFNNPEKLRNVAESMQDNLYSVAKDVESFAAGVSASYSERCIATSQGAIVSQKSSFNAFADINSIDYDYIISYSLPDNFSKVKCLARNVYEHLPKKFITPNGLNVRGKSVDVIFDPECFSAILRTLLSEKVYGSSKLAGLTKFRPGQKIANEIFTLIDTGVEDELLSSTPTDDEGTCSHENVVIQDGIFKMFLYDKASALKDNAESTGNGMRRAILAEDSIEAPVRETLRGLKIKPGEVRLNEMINDTKKGVYIKSLMGLHGANKARASFVAGVHCGKSIVNGNMEHVLQPGAWNIGANLFNLKNEKGMLQTIELSKETLNTGSAILPWVKVKLKF